MTIGVPVSIDTESISADIIDSTDIFNTEVFQDFPKLKRFRLGDNIYQNTVSDISVKKFNADTTYNDGDVIYGDPYELGRVGVHTVKSTGGKIQLNPQHYSTGVDTSFDYKSWTKRYVKIADKFIDNKINISYNGVYWEFLNLQNETVKTIVTYDGGEKMYFDPVNSYALIMSSTIDDPAELIAPTDSSTIKFWTPKVFIVNETGVYVRTHILSAAPEFVDMDPVYYYNETPASINGFYYIEKSNKMKPFDGKTYTVAKSSGSMTYTIKSLENFNSIVLSGVLADNIIINIKNASNSTVYTFDRNVDGRVDANAILDKYPTTEIFYNNEDTGIEIFTPENTVEIKLLGESITLGIIMLTKAVDAGFTNLNITNSYKDYSVFDYDPWGNADYVERAKVSTYNATVDIPISNYDMTDRLMKSLGKRVVVIDGADNLVDIDGEEKMFTATQKIGRILSYSQKTIVKDSDISKIATYSLKIEEIV